MSNRKSKSAIKITHLFNDKPIVITKDRFEIGDIIFIPNRYKNKTAMIYNKDKYNYYVVSMSNNIRGCSLPINVEFIRNNEFKKWYAHGLETDTVNKKDAISNNKISTRPDFRIKLVEEVKNLLSITHCQQIEINIKDQQIEKEEKPNNELLLKIITKVLDYENKSEVAKKFGIAPSTLKRFREGYAMSTKTHEKIVNSLSAFLIYL